MMTFTKARLLPLAVVLTYLCASVAGGEFRPNCNLAPCPSVRWADVAAGQTTAFVLTSSKRTTATNNWVSFAFADGPSMLQAQLVVDCYDVGGNSTMGTSKNVPGSTMAFDNKDSPADLIKLANRTARIDQGVYSCTFLMALPSASAYVMLAEGPMDPSSSAGPKKMYHNGRRWMSNAAYGFSSPTVPNPTATFVSSVKPASSLNGTSLALTTTFSSSLNSTSLALTTTFSTLTTAATSNGANENSSSPVSSTIILMPMNISLTPALSETSSNASTSQHYGNSTMTTPSVTNDGASTKGDTPTNKTVASTKGKESSADRVHQSWLVAVTLLGARAAVRQLVRGR